MPNVASATGAPSVASQPTASATGAAPRRRIAAFDAAKALALAAVVLGHTTALPRSLVDAVFSFHMPLFFIVSGYFFHADATCDRRFLRKGAQSLLVPYAWACLIVVVVQVVLGAFGIWAAPAEQLRTWVTAALYGAGGLIPGMPASVRGIGAIWFLLAMFWARVLLALAHRTPYPIVAVIMIFTVGWASANVPPLHWLPLSVQAGMCATLFLEIGLQMRRGRVFEPCVVPAAMWVVITLLWLWGTAFYGHLYMVSNTYGDGVVLDIVVGVCGTLAVIKACFVLERVAPRLARHLAWVGAMTLPLFCMHNLELIAVPWDAVDAWLAIMPLPVWIAEFALHVLATATLTGALRLLPRAVSGAFWPSLRAARDTRKGAARRPR